MLWISRLNSGWKVWFYWTLHIRLTQFAEWWVPGGERSPLEYLSTDLKADAHRTALWRTVEALPWEVRQRVYERERLAAADLCAREYEAAVQRRAQGRPLRRPWCWRLVDWSAEYLIWSPPPVPSLER